MCLRLSHRRRYLFFLIWFDYFTVLSHGIGIQEVLLANTLRWLVGLGVWFSLRVREVPGSNPGRALIFHFTFINTFIHSYMETENFIKSVNSLNFAKFFFCRLYHNINVNHINYLLIIHRYVLLLSSLRWQSFGNRILSHRKIPIKF